MTSTSRSCSACATPVPGDALFCPACGAATPTEFEPSTGAEAAAPAERTAGESAARRAQLQRALGSAFELRDLVGQGGFGEVWAAWDTRLKRDVAVKVLLADLAASPGLHTRFAREAAAAARLRHPNIVPIYQVGEADGLAYIIMPLVQGESLRAVLQREGALPIPAARRILAEAAAALDAAHKAGLVHRDVKPENIMLEGDDRRVLLMDFGIARAIEEGSARLTGTGLVIGTPQYMSPEQATAEKHIDHRADIYSLGVVAYEVLTGKLPFESESTRDLIVHHLTTAVKDPRASRAEIPEDVAEAVLRCLEKEPGDRWASAGDVARIFQPPVTISEVSPLEWLRRRLRLGARRSRRRIVVYATAFAAVFVTLAIFNPKVIGVALFYWVDVLRHGLGGGEAAAPDAPTRRPDEVWNTRSRPFSVRVGSLGDSAVLIAAPNQGVVAFDGSSWRTIPIPGVLASLPVIVARGGAAWIYARHRRAVVGYELTPQGVVARDTIRGGLSRTWSDGREALLLMDDGGVLRGQPGAWRREPTGVRSALDDIFGDSRRQVALGRSGGANLTDSLFIFNGLNWRGSDPRPDTTRVWKLHAGTALSDGTLLLTGSERSDRARGLIARLAPNGTTWSPLPNMPDSVTFRRVIATGPREVWLAGTGTGCHDVTCLYRLAGDSAQPVPGFGQHEVIGFARLRGELVAATSGGLLWAYRAGQWGLLSEIPGSLGRGVFPESELESGWSAATVLTERTAGARRAVEILLPGREAEWFDRKPMVFYSLSCVAGESVVVGVAAAYDNMAFILDDQMRVLASDDDSRGRYNALVRWRCPDDRRYRLGVRGFNGTETGPYQVSVWRGGVRDTTRSLTRSGRTDREIALDATVSGALSADAPRAMAWLSEAGVVYQAECDAVGRCGAPREAAAPEAIGDIAVLGPSLIAAGNGRVYRRADQRWQPMAADAPMGAITALAGTAGMAAALTPDAVWRAGATQPTWRRWHRLPGWIGRPRQLALSTDGRGAIVVGEQSIALLSDSAEPTEIRLGATPDDVLFLPDGRIVFALTSRDPLVGGNLYVQAAGSGQQSPQRLPEHRNIRGLSTDGRRLYVAASGWTTLMIQLKDLPYAPPDSAATPSP